MQELLLLAGENEFRVDLEEGLARFFARGNPTPTPFFNSSGDLARLVKPFHGRRVLGYGYSVAI